MRVAISKVLGDGFRNFFRHFFVSFFQLLGAIIVYLIVSAILGFLLGINWSICSFFLNMISAKIFLYYLITFVFVNENNDIWNYVAGGQYDKREEAEATKKHLIADELKESTVVNLSNFYTNAMQYKNAKVENKTEEVTKIELPEISSNIMITLRKFSVDKNFKIKELILIDSELAGHRKFKDIGYDFFYYLTTAYMPTYSRLIEDSIARSSAIYEDKLTDKKIGVSVFLARDNARDSLMDF